MSDDRDEIKSAVGSIRHDLNNLLMGLVGHVELLRGARGLPDDAHRRLGIISDHLDRIRNKVGELARYGSKPGDGHEK
jgi:signal transduction histidine kinase